MLADQLGSSPGLMVRVPVPCRSPSQVIFTQSNRQQLHNVTVCGWFREDGLVDWSLCCTLGEAPLHAQPSLVTQPRGNSKDSRSSETCIPGSGEIELFLSLLKRRGGNVVGPFCNGVGWGAHPVRLACLEGSNDKNNGPRSFSSEGKHLKNLMSALAQVQVGPVFASVATTWESKQANYPKGRECRVLTTWTTRHSRHTGQPVTVLKTARVVLLFPFVMFFIKSNFCSSQLHLHLPLSGQESSRFT